MSGLDEAHFDLADRMIQACVQAQVGGFLPSVKQMNDWRIELKDLLTVDDADLMVRILSASYPEQLIHVAGVIMGRESGRRNSGG
jgi:hypothetical protein